MRTAEVTRNTKETQIRVKLNLDGKGAAKLSTGLTIYHMAQDAKSLYVIDNASPKILRYAK